MYLSLFSGISALIVALGFGRFAYTPMVPVMMEQAHLGVDYAGFIASANYLGYIVGALTPLFWKGEGVRTKTLRWGIVLTVLGLFLMAVDYPEKQKIPMWSLARFLNGVGSGWMLINISSMVLERLAQFKRLTLAGWLYSGVGIGSLIVTFMVMLFEYRELVWNLDWFYLACWSVLFSIPAWLYLTDARIEAGYAFKRAKNKLTEEHFAKKTYTFSSINIPAVWYLAFSYVCKGFSYIIVMTFLPVMSAGLGFWAESSWLILLIVSIPSTLLWGWLSEHYGNIRCLQIAFLLEGVGILFPVILHNEVGVLICALLVGGTFMGIVTMVTAQAQRIEPQASTMIIALITGVYGIGQIIGPGFAGWVAARTGSFDIALLSAALLMFAGFFLLARLRAAKRQMQATNAG